MFPSTRAEHPSYHIYLCIVLKTFESRFGTYVYYFFFLRVALYMVFEFVNYVLWELCWNGQTINFIWFRDFALVRSRIIVTLQFNSAWAINSHKKINNFKVVSICKVYSSKVISFPNLEWKMFYNTMKHLVR